MSYHPPPPSEPSGCVQTLVISRMIFQILAIPILLILGALLAVMLFFFAFNEHPLLGVAAIAVFGLLFYGVVKWEKRRVERDLPPELRR